MNKREKMLAVAVAAILLLWVGNYYYGVYAKTLQSRRAAVTRAESQLNDANRKLRLGRKAVEQMDAWQQRSLPANFEKALSLYKAWLLAKANDAGLKVNDITYQPTTGGSTAYKAIGYHLTGSGSLSSVTAMLYEFYHSSMLHQINHLQISRVPGSPVSSVTLDVEALSMRDAVATNKLPEGDSKRLKLASADEYKKSLSERDLAAAYTPPSPPRPPRERTAPPRPAKFDDSALARFSGAVNNGDGAQAWIYVLPTGETLHVMAGDPIKIGALEGKIESIEDRALVYKSGKKRFRVPIGKYLREGTEIGAAGSDAKDNQPEKPESGPRASSGKRAIER
jgi:hypothetical protein